ncbi:MAG: L,D-transpeptidase family protein, partial [Proteobacteria bacterium]|nr:L,D-transpeptidase family protein [Pseudomonadota bacterium]
MTIRHLLAAGLLTIFVLPIPTALKAGDFPVADMVVIEKAERKLHLMRNGEIFRTFAIALGIRPVGDKKQEGDFKTPEGKYNLDMRNAN